MMKQYSESRKERPMRQGGESMRQAMNAVMANMDVFDEQTLRDLNRRVVDQLKALRDKEDLEAASKWRVGEAVEFMQDEWDRRFSGKGRVKTVNQRTLTVSVEGGQTWRVSFCYCRKVV